MDELERNPIDGGQESVVDSQEGAGAGTEGTGDAARAKTDHQFNAAMRAARLAGRAEAERELKSRYGESIRGMRMKNPYTGAEIATLDDLDQYGAALKEDKLKKRAQAENRDVSELKEEEENKEFVSKLRRQSAQQEARQKQMDERREFLVKDLKNFTGKYPDVDVGKLEENPKFRAFSKGRLYQEPLADIYGDFLEFVSDTEKAAIGKKQDRDSRSTGAGGSTAGTTLTAAEQKRLDEWNAKCPDMKMSPREFAARRKG